MNLYATIISSLGNNLDDDLLEQQRMSDIPKMI